MKIGLFFGSFNPIHVGHMAIAQYMLEHTDIDKIWFVVEAKLQTIFYLCQCVRAYIEQLPYAPHGSD
jgi:cytidyltransferase-like protein